MAKFRNRARERHGDLVVQCRVPNMGGKVAWKCLCDCGNYVIVRGSNLGSTRSCGCRKRRRMIEMNVSSTTHGDTGSVEYMAWVNMWQRCTNENHPHYKDYGGRGISVCKEWKDYSAFLNDMGRKPSPLLELDRIDNNSGYRKTNCRWATKATQLANRRNTRRAYA